MRDPTENGAAQIETGSPYAPKKNSGSGKADQLDLAGQSILRLLHKAAGVAEENSRHALGMAEKLSQQLRAAEGRLAEMEAEIVTQWTRGSC